MFTCNMYNTFPRKVNGEQFFFKLQSTSASGDFIMSIFNQVASQSAHLVKSWF